MLPRPPQAITFDCWMTLIRDIDSVGADRIRSDFLAQIAAANQVSLDGEAASALIKESWQQHHSKWVAGELFGASGAARWCLEQLEIDPDPDALGRFTELLESVTISIGTRPVEGAREAVERVKSRGIATALICDTGFTPGRLVRKMLEDHRILLDHYFFSDEIGSPKPFSPIFNAAIEATRADPARSIHIGDLRRTDVAGARLAGMSSIRFAGVHDDGAGLDDPDAPDADAVLKSWANLDALVGL